MNSNWPIVEYAIPGRLFLSHGLVTSGADDN